jgi:hypothetical protein
MATTIEAGFNELLERQRLTSTQVQTADTRVAALKAFFAKNFEMAEPAFTTGSYARGTICAGQRDVDLMAPLDYATYKARFDNDSRAFLYYVRGILNDRYASTTVSSKRVAVTLDFQSISADVVPCFLRADDGRGYWMPDGAGDWQDTSPRFHTNLINTANSAHNDQLKPLIRLMKCWNLANSSHLRSFHVEILVQRMWDSQTIGSSWPRAVAATLAVMASWVEDRCKDPWDGSAYVDDYLSEGERSQVARMLRQDAGGSADAEQHRQAGRHAAAFERWATVFPGTFPRYG